MRSDESRRRERESAHQERLAADKSKRAKGELPAPRKKGRRRNERTAAEERRGRAGRPLPGGRRPAPNVRCLETRAKAVFGAGDADAELMFVGEAPGAEEARLGLPFVGRAGQLLNELLEGIGMTREDVFIANVLKSRPPGNRDPQPGEIEACRPYLFEQVRLIEPKVVCTLGNFATKLLTGNPAGITRGSGDTAGALAGRPGRLPAAALPPGRRPADPGDEGDAARRLETPPGAARRARSRRRPMPEEGIEEAPVPGPPQPP